MPNKERMKPHQLSKHMRAEIGEDAFKLKYGTSRSEWIDAKVRAGVGRSEAEAEARERMVKARDADIAERVEAAARTNAAWNILAMSLSSKNAD